MALLLRCITTLALALALVTTAARADTAPVTSLKLSFHVKRSSMAVHGYSDFDVVVNPVVSTPNNTTTGTQTVSFDGAATFVEDGRTHTYVLVDGVPYHTIATTASAEVTTVCGSAAAIPPVHTVLDALAQATPVASVDAAQPIDCAHGTLLTTMFAGEQFVLCTASNARGNSFKAFGEDLDITFEYLAYRSVITKPAGAPATCTAVAEPTASLASSSLGLLSGAPQTTTFRRSLRRAAQSVELASASCGCRGVRKPCLFLHGMDVAVNTSSLVDDSAFFGDHIKQHAPCCSSFKFARMNTVDNAWTDDTLQDETCAFALSMSPQSNLSSRTVEDTIIVAHSMGNLQLAGAVATGKCSLGATTQWIDLSGPLRGSMGSDLIRTVCDGGDTGRDILKALGGLIGQCPGTATRRSLVYDGGEYCSPTMAEAYAAARKVHAAHVTASICGDSFAGLLSKESAGLFLGGLLIPHKSKANDGVVELTSCIGDVSASQYRADYASAFYRAKLNHADTTMHNGDALFDKAMKPVKWFECLL